MRITHRQARWVARFASLLIRSLGVTWRVRVSGFDRSPMMPDLVFAFWHGDMLIPAHVFRREPCAVMISAHRDGELITQIVERIGRHRAVRGSTTRGGARAILELMQQHGEVPWSITPDGPRGPRGHVNEGAITLAAHSRRPLVAVGFAVSRGKRFDSWDRFVVPAPFARVACHMSEPLGVPAEVSRDERADLARQLEQMLQNAHEEAVRRLDNW